MKAISFIGLFFLATLSFTNATRCSLAGSPVCAKYQNDYRVFHNGCIVFSQNHNTNENWVTMPMIDCFNAGCTPFSCSNSEPICASNSGIVVQFTGRCDFLILACTNYSTGWVIENCPVSG